MRRENLAPLQIVRALCIIAVLCVHSTSNAIAEMKESNYYLVYNFLNTFMRYGTPTFIFLSSFVLFYNYYEAPLTGGRIGRFYGRRLKFILLPYFLFSVFYYLVAYELNHYDLSLAEAIGQFGRKALVGKAFFHLYFVFVNVQFYLFFPLALWTLKKVPGLLKWCIPLGLALEYGFVLLNKYDWHVTHPGSWMLSYVAYYLLGAYLGSCFPRIKGWIVASRDNATKARVAFWVLIWGGWLAAALSHVFVYYQQRMYGTRYNTLLYDFLWNAHTYLGVVVLIQIAFFIHRRLSKRALRMLSLLGSLSFGIYLIHPFFLVVYESHPPSTGNSMLIHAWYAGKFLIVLGCSWLTVGLAARYFPFSWIFFGNSSLREVGKARRVSDPGETGKGGAWHAD
ncbi:acyltransferase [Cohnella terricola]|uniref:Acyltransferase n=1 Tax=Cohnella terricola TaxID=1289167 RepID=A0A559JH35_9BACL|nr:acyltransferase [Cohnella terricola]